MNYVLHYAMPLVVLLSIDASYSLFLVKYEPTLIAYFAVSATKPIRGKYLSKASELGIFLQRASFM